MVFPAKELYRDISFTLETGRHCALIGSNGTGKSTLADMIMHPEAYFFDGKIVRDEKVAESDMQKSVQYQGQGAGRYGI